jgi:hypothetical protein
MWTLDEHGQSENMSAAIDSIELLREYRTRLVADVVTGKLDMCPAARTPRRIHRSRTRSRPGGIHRTRRNCRVRVS